jgi:pyridoxamine 5'-phosphate oxidase
LCHDREVASESTEHPPRSIDVEALRRTYGSAGLSEADVADDPITQFDRWLSTALAEGIVEPNAMVVATADADGRPSARTVLLKGYDARGFSFFTNLGSRKGREAAGNPRASLVFPWYAMERQVIVVGDIEPVDHAEAEAYWATRPYGSRIGAWASPQSQPVSSRAVLDERWAAAHERFPDAGAVPLPDHWGGLRVVPLTVEFWQGRRDRLHDRLRYGRSSADGAWSVERLAP